MRTVLADHDIEGQVLLLKKLFESRKWIKRWREVDSTVQTFVDLKIDPSISDKDLWMLCQQQRMVLVTANRNEDSADSLGAAIQSLNDPGCLPVFTVSDPQRLLRSSAYRGRVAERLLGYLQEIDSLLGVGRLYIP